MKPQTERFSIEDWSRLIGEVMACFGDEELLASKLIEVLTALTPDGEAGFLVYRKRGANYEFARFPPIELGPSFKPAEFVRFVSDSVGRGSGCYLLREIAPPGFEDSTLFRAIYEDRGFVDEVAHVCEISDEVGISAVTARSTPFSKQDYRRHRRAYPIIAACCRRLIEISTDPVSRRLPSLEVPNVDKALDRFGDAILSPRECDVVHLMLVGHSLESIAHQLGISINTAKHHRKGAYSKLKINSQGELFYTFLRTIGLSVEV